MFCGNSMGEFLPPMVVYKAKARHLELEIGGSVGTIYSVSKKWLVREEHLPPLVLCGSLLMDARTAVKPGKAIKVGDMKKIFRFDDTKWWCNLCSEVWKKGEKWIACDNCDRFYHLKCTPLVKDGTIPDFVCIECTVD